MYTFTLRNAGHWPDSLEVLVTPDENNVTYLETELPIDPWGNAYQYRPPLEEGDTGRIWSIGPNGFDEDGGGDDIVVE